MVCLPPIFGKSLLFSFASTVHWIDYYHYHSELSSVEMQPSVCLMVAGYFLHCGIRLVPVPIHSKFISIHSLQPYASTPHSVLPSNQLPWNIQLNNYAARVTRINFIFICFFFVNSIPEIPLQPKYKCIFISFTFFRRLKPYESETFLPPN